MNQSSLDLLPFLSFRNNVARVDLLGRGLTKATVLRHSLVCRNEWFIFIFLDPGFMAINVVVLGSALALAKLEVQN